MLATGSEWESGRSAASIWSKGARGCPLNENPKMASTICKTAAVALSTHNFADSCSGLLPNPYCTNWASCCSHHAERCACARGALAAHQVVCISQPPLLHALPLQQRHAQGAELSQQCVVQGPLCLLGVQHLPRQQLSAAALLEPRSISEALHPCCGGTAAHAAAVHSRSSAAALGAERPTTSILARG